MKKTNKLIPVDKNRCQTMITATNPFSFGTTKPKQCINTPVWIATEKKVAEDGLRGSMSLCESCKKKMIKILGKYHATFKPIKRKEQ